MTRARAIRYLLAQGASREEIKHARRVFDMPDRTLSDMLSVLYGREIRKDLAYAEHPFLEMLPK